MAITFAKQQIMAKQILAITSVKHPKQKCPKTKLQDTPTQGHLQVLEILEANIFLRPGRSYVRNWQKLVYNQI